MKDKGLSLFLDSGAFSAHTQGVKINIDEYIQFIKDNQDIIDIYSVLDVIGDAEGTLKNQTYMEQAGLRPIPCFHFGEELKYLKHYAANYYYISLGGMVGGQRESLQAWLDICWKYLVDNDGMPICKVHGFGMTSLFLLKRYPWYSVDSATWVIASRNGIAFIPQYECGTWTFDKDPWKIIFSNKSSKRSNQDSRHYDSLPHAMQKRILDYLDYRGYSIGKSEIRTESTCYELKTGERWFGKVQGSSRKVETVLEEGLINSYKARDEINILYFLDLGKSFPEWPWKWELGKSNRSFER